MSPYTSLSILQSPPEFDGYGKLAEESEITVLTTETEIVEALTDGQAGTIIVKKTPFYATMGGQQADVE